MNWEQIVQDHAKAISNAGLEYDAFSLLARVDDPTQPASMRNGRSAKVTYTVSRSLGYGELKCSATVTIECPQTEGYINMAGELAFEKAKELVNDGFGSLVPDSAPLPVR